MGITPLTTESDLDRFLANHPRAIIFKHSTRCEISSAANAELEAFARKAPTAPIGRILVVEHREVSRRAAELLGVVHQSPQTLLVEEGKSTWDASHWAVTCDAVARVWGQAPAEVSPPKERH